MMNNIGVLFETEDYYIDSGKSDFIITGPDIKPDIYLIINKKTNMIEAENRVLGHAIGWCKHIQLLLDNALENKVEAIADIPDPGPPSVPTKTV